ncbi:hypothetical protein ACB098_09G083900 [Castanea mollissima]|uniref:Uncharacterized protein n=1 Tax=Castanea mollissima TaxID=60419 RepID=A0A8J4RIT5_9ROSI|nr:hypothetical protein CMV_002677 [Castanea mollissima]
MEDSIIETENLVHPTNLSPKGVSKVREDHEEEDDDKKDHEAKGGEERQAGFINNLLSKIVPGGEAEEEKEHDEDRRGSFGEDKYEDKGVGLISHYISNLVSPLSPKAGKFTGQRVEDFEAGNGGSSKVEEDVGGGRSGGQLKQGKIEEEEGEGGGGKGGIIDNLVSHLPASLTDNAAPTADEASILIHSIIHD